VNLINEPNSNYFNVIKRIFDDLMYNICNSTLNALKFFKIKVKNQDFGNLILIN